MILKSAFAVKRFIAPNISHYFHYRKFPGWALSHKDWTDELDKLVEDLTNQVDVDDSGVYYTAGYNGNCKAFFRLVLLSWNIDFLQI